MRVLCIYIIYTCISRWCFIMHMGVLIEWLVVIFVSFSPIMYMVFLLDMAHTCSGLVTNHSGLDTKRLRQFWSMQMWQNSCRIVCACERMIMHSLTLVHYGCVHTNEQFYNFNLVYSVFCGGISSCVWRFLSACQTFYNLTIYWRCKRKTRARGL